MLDINPSDPRPATPAMIAAMKPLVEAPRISRLVALLWEQGGQWVYLPGWWHEDWGQWVADCVLTCSYEIPSVPTRFAPL